MGWLRGADDEKSCPCLLRMWKEGHPRNRPLPYGASWGASLMVALQVSPCFIAKPQVLPAPIVSSYGNVELGVKTFYPSATFVPRGQMVGKAMP